MSNNATAASSFPAKGNPYETLSLPNFATPAAIKKKFRQLSLKYHPDKRQQNLTKLQTDELDKQFIAVQEARDFLLNDDHKDEKEKYDAKLKGEVLRKEQEKARDAAMSSRRKRMRDDLESKIRNLSRTDHDVGESAEDEVEELKRDGKRMQEEFRKSERTAEERVAARERKKRKTTRENRQVRVKWSRKKMGGQSDDMIRKLLSRFGEVESVELIGSKGNAALATFVDASSCKPCVDFYSNSQELRATYVGKRKDEEDMGFDFPKEPVNLQRDRESVEERNLRQAAEREVLLRKMEMEDENHDHDIPISKQNETQKEKDSSRSAKQSSASSLFPPTLPPCKLHEQSTMPTFLERLQSLEKKLLAGILSPEAIKEMEIPI
jgi:DnaJ family protein C protein 17